MTKSQWHFPLKVRVDGELMSKKSLSPKICEQGTTFLLMAFCLALPKVQSSQGLKVLVTWILTLFAVDLVIATDGWLSSTCRLLISCLMKAVAYTAFSSIVVMSLDSAIKDNITDRSNDNDIVCIVTLNLVSAQKFACEQEKICTRRWTKLHRP